MKTIKKILNKYKYKALFDSYHKQADIIHYAKRKDHVSTKKQLTITTPDGHVVGRLYDVTSPTAILTDEQIIKIVNFFEMFQIPSADKISEELQTLIKKVS